MSYLQEQLSKIGSNLLNEKKITDFKVLSFNKLPYLSYGENNTVEVDIEYLEIRFSIRKDEIINDLLFISGVLYFCKNSNDLFNDVVNEKNIVFTYHNNKIEYDELKNIIAILLEK